MRTRSFILSAAAILMATAVIIVSAGCARQENVLRVNLGGNPATLDPQKTNSARDLSVSVQMFDGLLGFEQDLTIMPVIAAEIPSEANGGISADGTAYTFKLRTDAAWSDGEPVTAGDFVYSIRRLFASETEAPYRNVFYVIKNAIPYRRGEVPAEEIGVKAIDDHTLEIRLEAPTASFLERMALWAVFPLRQDIIEAAGEEDWTRSPETFVGNGPFILSEWVEGDHITLEKNPDYLGTPAGIDGVRYSMYEDTTTEYQAYQSGELDITRIPSGMERTLADSAELLAYHRLKTNALFFDTNDGPFDNVKLRQAFATAIDRNALVDVVQGGRGSVTYTWIPAGMPGYPDEYQTSLGEQYAFDPERAAALLTEAGYPGGEGLPPITLVYSNVGSNPAVIQSIQEQLLASLGIDVETVGVSVSLFWDRIYDEHDSWDIAFLSFSADYADPDNWLPDFFMSEGIYNERISMYSNANFDLLVNTALAETNDIARLSLWMDAEDIMLKDAPAVFLFNDEMFVLVSERVSGITGTAMDLYIPGDLRLETVTLK